MESFSSWFETAVTEPGQPVVRPHPWQLQLAVDDSCYDRLIRIPTGLGKTLGVLLTWVYHRLHRQDEKWPRRLVWCLPMRTLVDQTADETKKVISRLGLGNDVDVHRLMGGIDETQWYGDPERPAVLVGTQDMLLSRALNRGYAMGRAAWPRAFGMLHSDALWVMDEIQLMGVGLTTSAQIQAFWHEESEKWRDLAALPRATWWMSATLQPEWLRSPETDIRMEGGTDAIRVDRAANQGDVVDLDSRYVIDRLIGRGGMGAVMLATDTRLNRKVAIKRIRADVATSDAAMARFINEAQAIAALNHQNVVQIHDYGQAKDGPFLIMEYVDGGSLADRCQEGALPLEEAIELACHVCDGLAKAHDAGIIHRDIKPANILLTSDGVPKLTDFGLAKAATSDHQMTITGAVLGTPDFMPPEQRRDAAQADHRSDLWSLAATLYQMVTGESPKIIRIKKVPAQLQPHSKISISLAVQGLASFQSLRFGLLHLRATLISSPSSIPTSSQSDCFRRVKQKRQINSLMLERRRFLLVLK